MTAQDFVFWIRGYLASQHDSQIKVDIEKVLSQINEQTSRTNSYSATPSSTFTYNTKQQLND